LEEEALSVSYDKNAVQARLDRRDASINDLKTCLIAAHALQRIPFSRSIDISATPNPSLCISPP